MAKRPLPASDPRQPVYVTTDAYYHNDILALEPDGPRFSFAAILRLGLFFELTDRDGDIQRAIFSGAYGNRIIPDRDEHVIIVMPYLQQWYYPKFRTVGEGVQFFGEMLEGLQFIHENHVAHRDGGFTNFMMDASQMYGPEGVHPHERDKKYDFSGRARPYSRTERPLKYHFIVFGLSDIYDPDDLPATMCALEGRDKTVLEFFAYNPGTKRTPKHDPFAVDVYYLQSLPPQYYKLARELRGMKGFEFMEPLIAAMTLQSVSLSTKLLKDSLSSRKASAG
ncbi:hypothetical protein ARMGADRAFT_1060698 [Armillaria gallica]|uniref:Protein kinase domain-containing protein n=1 Tax=Armillaria gallica TaxID=47427 RepID=A0A2H3DQN7_ARMGA|nr:hypothetical protein ARMGADRAFT_1060698 [Armillaria gallica]